MRDNYKVCDKGIKHYYLRIKLGIRVGTCLVELEVHAFDDFKSTLKLLG